METLVRAKINWHVFYLLAFYRNKKSRLTYSNK